MNEKQSELIQVIQALGVVVGSGMLSTNLEIEDLIDILTGRVYLPEEADLLKLVVSTTRALKVAEDQEEIEEINKKFIEEFCRLQENIKDD